MENKREEKAAMQEAVALLRKQLLTGNNCVDWLQQLKKALLHSSGREITGTVQALEPALGDYVRLEEEQSAFLKAHGSSRMSAFLASQPDSVERDVAFRLVDKVNVLGKELRESIALNQELMSRSKDYIDYHMNLMSGVKAGTIYSAPGGPGRDGGRDRKMFDSSV
jgi:hypothetical protein